jgi:2-phosphosulfolactate phosphatase
MQKQVIIDCFPESARKYREGYAIVAVDVIRATTSAITVASRGGRCIPAASVDAAFELRRRLQDPLLAGEIGGEIAPGFEINNSPAELDARDLHGRPVVLLSSSGTRLICEAKGCEVVHLACFRNYAWVARHLEGRHSHVAVIGAGSRGEFREEDQMCCAWIARDLSEMGYAPGDRETLDIIKRWSYAGPEAALNGKSADYLRRSGQTNDLEFIISHINDLHAAYVMQGEEVVEWQEVETAASFARNNGVYRPSGVFPQC